MGKHEKNLFWPQLFPNPNYILCHSNDKDTWPHLLSLCILPCTCHTTRSTYLVGPYPDIMYIKGATQEQNGPFLPTPNLAVQIIEFTFTHDRFTSQAIKIKQDKYDPFISTIEEQGWLVNPLIIITVEVCRSIHMRKHEITIKIYTYPINSSKDPEKNMQQCHKISNLPHTRQKETRQPRNTTPTTYIRTKIIINAPSKIIPLIARIGNKPYISDKETLNILGPTN